MKGESEKEEKRKTRAITLARARQIGKKSIKYIYKERERAKELI